jgi:hypothetical protein
MNYALTAILLLSLPALAARKSYDVRLNVELNDEKFASPVVAVKEGETTTVFVDDPKGERFIQITPASYMGGIRMKMELGTIDELGERHILAQPEMIVEENETAKLEVKEEEKAKMSLSVLATQKPI